MKKVNSNTSLLLWIKNKQNKKRSIRERWQERNGVEAEEQKVERLRKKREQQQQRERQQTLEVLRRNTAERVASETAEER